MPAARNSFRIAVIVKLEFMRPEAKGDWSRIQDDDIEQLMEFRRPRGYRTESGLRPADFLDIVDMLPDLWTENPSTREDRVMFVHIKILTMSGGLHLCKRQCDIT